MSVCLLIIDDGRGHLDGCLESCAQYLPPMDACVMVDDSGHELGFAGAIQAGWDGVLETGCEFVFHLESDFRFCEPVDLRHMERLQEAMPSLAQITLKRQPWNPDEVAAGGVVELHPEDFERRSSGRTKWTEHRRFFTTNPSLYRASICERGWPQRRRSEGMFTHELLDAGYSFAIWGPKFAPPMVEHVGKARAGFGY